MPRFHFVRFSLCLVVLGGTASLLAAEPATPEKIAFFESRIRPILIDACYECHSTAGKREGGLALDHRAALLAGGDRGPALEIGKGNESLIVQAMRHQVEDLRMPKGGPKPSDAVTADFVRWINDGAIDPREKPPTADELAKETSWEAVRERRKHNWSFQPLRSVAPPEIAEVKHSVDRFLLAKQQTIGLKSSPEADRATLHRRVAMALTGLPPTSQEMQAFLAENDPQAYERFVDRLLASPRFGERWARHWMDWFRYAETHGSEGDTPIPNAWRYRDYLIRALNDDVPYDRLVREHIAGDLIASPRVNRETMLNESALGIGHFRMVPHGFAPTDALDEQVRFTDNQIDVVSKAFLGLTVSCARCHHHKFDPISQDDFYGWYGIFASCVPGTITVDSPDKLNKNRAELIALKGRIKDELARSWETSAANLSELLAAEKPSPTLQKAIDEAATEAQRHPLFAWRELSKLSGDEFVKGWQRLARQADEAIAKQREFEKSTYTVRWKLDAADPQLYRHGIGLADGPSPAGEFHIPPSGELVVNNIYPAGTYTHGLSNKHNGVILSPRFRNDCEEIFIRIAGGGNARARYVVQNYPRVTLLYPHLTLAGETLKWQKLDPRYWKDDFLHIEIATGDDLATDANSPEGRSWFGVSEIVGRRAGDGPPPVDLGAPLFALLSDEMKQHPPTDTKQLAQLYATVLADCVRAWRAGTMTNAQAEFLGPFVRQRVLPNGIGELPAVATLVQEYRRLEAEVPIPTRAPGVHDVDSYDQPLFERGDHEKPLATVPRRFLEAIDARDYKPQRSGRIELAASLADGKIPLVPRVAVNRVWHHLFGRGLVATPDNFGALGEAPTHPELLDHLASQFAGKTPREQAAFAAWSIKGLVRHLVLSDAFRRSSQAPPNAKQLDPENKWLTHFRVRRLEAETIRDSLLAVSGTLDETRFGPPVAGNSRRRSIYVQLRRNALDPFLTTFDFPEPSSTWGRREATNIPAQSLALLNDPLVIDLSRAWSENVLKDESLKDDAARVRAMLGAVLGRTPSDEESSATLAFLQLSGAQHEGVVRQTERLKKLLAMQRDELDRIVAPVRARLREGKKNVAASPVNEKLPQPIARWMFDGDLKDSVGKLHGQAKSPGRDLLPPVFDDRALRVDERHFVETAPLEHPLTAKTLEAWVRLDDLNQRGGGVMSVESIGGATFDGIVFSEQEPQRWMSGSDFYRRSQGFGGEAEKEAANRPVHIAITYAADGTITAYREGRPLGKAYKSSGPLANEAGKSHVLFGLRHSPPGGNHHLQGRIYEARLYDRALSAEEIAASAASFSETVSDADVLAALTDAERKDVQKRQVEIDAMEKELAGFGPPSEWTADAKRRWQDLAQSLFNLKEFLYLR